MLCNSTGQMINAIYSWKDWNYTDVNSKGSLIWLAQKYVWFWSCSCVIVFQFFRWEFCRLTELIVERLLVPRVFSSRFRTFNSEECAWLCLFLCVCVCLSLSISRSVCASISHCARLSTSIFLFVCVSLSLFESRCVAVLSPFAVSVFVSICISRCISRVYLFISVAVCEQFVRRLVCISLCLYVSSLVKLTNHPKFV